MGATWNYVAGWNYDDIAKLIEDWKKSGKSQKDYFHRPVHHRRPTSYDRYWEFLGSGRVNLDRWGEMDNEEREINLDLFYGDPERRHDGGTLLNRARYLMDKREAKREALIPQTQFEAFKKQYGLTKWDPRIGNMYRRARNVLLGKKKPLPFYMALDPDVLRLMFEEEAIKAKSQTPESSPEKGQFIGPGRVERMERRRGDDLQVDSGRSWHGQQQSGYSGPGNYVQPAYQGGSIHQPSIQEDPYAVEATRPMTPIGQGRRQQPILGRRGW